MARKPGIELHSIIQTSREIVDEKGIHALTLATVAKKLSIRTPSLYNHIESLTALRKALAVHGLEALYHHLTHSLSDQSGDKAIHTFSLAYIQFVRKHPGLYEATLWAGEAPVSPEAEKVTTGIVGLVVKLLNYYQLEGEDAIHAARGLRSILHGFASLDQHHGFGLPVDLDISIKRMIDVFIAGIDKVKSK